mgnify:CR=1 FL=1
MLGAVFDEALLRAVAIGAAARRDQRSTASSRPISSRWSGTGATGDRYRFTHALVHEVVYQNLLLSRRTELHERVGRALERRRLAPGATERPRSARPPLEPQLGQAQGRPLSAGRRRLGARGLCERRCDPPLRARAAHARRVPGLRRRGAGRARAARRSAGAHRPARRGPRALRRRCGEELEAAGDRAGAARLHREDRRAALGGGRSRARRTPASRRASSCSATTAIRSSARTSSRRWAGSRFAPATMPPPSHGPSGRSRKRRAREAPSSPTARARPPRCARRPTTRSASRSRERAASAEAVDQIEQQRRAGRGARSAAGGLPRLHEPRRALQLARPAAAAIETCLRGLETAKKVGDLGFQSRLYANLAVAYCALTDRCEAEGVEAAQHGHRPRPPAGSARSPGGAADRARADSPVSRRSRPGLRLVRGGARPGRAGRRAPAAVPLLRWPGHAAISMPGTAPRPSATWRRRRRSASGPGSSLTR